MDDLQSRCFGVVQKKSQITENGRWEKHINPYIGNVEIEKITALDYIKLKIELEKKI